VNYYWTECPGCGCEVAINLTESAAGATGSLRRWSRDRSINDGKPIRLAAGAMDPVRGFRVPCVCGHELEVSGKPSAVGEEREEDLRVRLSD
jgi:hypothetical protein